jgi:hypothetical protein
MRGEGLRACNAGKVAALLSEVTKAPGKVAQPARAAKEVLRCMDKDNVTNFV